MQNLKKKKWFYIQNTSYTGSIVKVYIIKMRTFWYFIYIWRTQTKEIILLLSIHINAVLVNLKILIISFKFNLMK